MMSTAKGWGIIIAIVIGGVALGLCARSLSMWSPEHQAQATIALEQSRLEATPTAMFNEKVLPTVQAEQGEMLIETNRIIHAASRTIVITFAISAIVIGLSIVGIIVSVAIRHWKRTLQLPPVQPLSRKPIHMFPDGHVYDWRSGAVDDTSLPQPADIARIEAIGLSEARRIQVIGEIAKSLMVPGEWNIAKRKQYEWIKSELENESRKKLTDGVH